MGQLSLSGVLIESPQPCGDSDFPSATVTMPFVQNPPTCPKPVAVSTGRKLLNINSPGAYVQVIGSASDASVTQIATLYARTMTTGMRLRVTYNNPLGGAIVSVLPVNGLFIQEPDVAGGYYATTVEVEGTGTIELYASGQQ